MYINCIQPPYPADPVYTQNKATLHINASVLLYFSYPHKIHNKHTLFINSTTKIYSFEPHYKHNRATLYLNLFYCYILLTITI